MNEIKKELPDFDGYQFSKATRIKYKGHTFEVIEVDFEEGTVGVESPFDGRTEYIYYCDVEDIWQAM